MAASGRLRVRGPGSGLVVLSVVVPAVVIEGVFFAVLAGPAAAAACPSPASQGPSDVTNAVQTSSSSQTGVYDTMTVTVVPAAGGPASGYCVDFAQNSGPSSGWPRSAISDASGHASVTWTSFVTSPGNSTDSITASTTDANKGVGQTQTLRHVWTAPPTPTPKPTTSLSPKPTLSPTGQPSAPPTGSPSGSATPSGPPSALPGGTAKIFGNDCPPGQAVRFSILGQPTGSSVAGPDGTFSGDLTLPLLAIGEYQVQVTCGARTGSVPIDLVVSSSKASAAGAGATSAAILLFFVLLASALFGRRATKPNPDLASVKG